MPVTTPLPVAEIKRLTSLLYSGRRLLSFARFGVICMGTGNERCGQYHPRMRQNHVDISEARQIRTDVTTTRKLNRDSLW